MLAEVAAGRQLGERSGLDVGRAFQDFDGAWARLQRRGMRRVVVPLEVIAFPASTEERMEAGVVVLVGRLDLAGLCECDRLVADGLPVAAQVLQLWEIGDLQVRRARHARE